MAARNWTIEQRQQQAQAMQRWKPWKVSTGPKTIDGKKKASRNAYKGGGWLKLREGIKNLNQVLRWQME